MPVGKYVSSSLNHHKWLIQRGNVKSVYGSGIFSLGSCAPFVELWGSVRQDPTVYLRPSYLVSQLINNINYYSTAVFSELPLMKFTSNWLQWSLLIDVFCYSFSTDFELFYQIYSGCSVYLWGSMSVEWSPVNAIRRWIGVLCANRLHPLIHTFIYWWCNAGPVSQAMT